MTTHNETDTVPEVQTEGHQAGGDLFNTAAGWVLFAAGLGLGLSILSGKYFHGNDPQRPEQLGYVIEGVVEESGAAAELTMAEALNLEGVDAAAGEKVFAKCSACHSIEAGGANGVGPNLHAIMGANIAAKPGFAYSDALASKGGQWTWDEMNAWLKNPKGYATGTKMSFAGLSKIEDRAAVALYMNSMGSNIPVPAAPAAAAPEGEGAAEGEAAEGAEAGAAEAQAGADAVPETEAAE
jgi:cytochrome c